MPIYIEGKQNPLSKLYPFIEVTVQPNMTLRMLPKRLSYRGIDPPLRLPQDRSAAGDEHGVRFGESIQARPLPWC
jgi:hypothetical protein